MKAINLDSVPYKHRFNGASLLISKANRMVDLPLPDQKADQQRLLAALAYYDMALALMKPFDPNYSTVVMWKCNLLVALSQYEDAVNWYREIVLISNEVDGKAQRNATAAQADEMIQKYAGRKNEPLAIGKGEVETFDDPPYCMFAEDFCGLLSQGKFKKAHLYLSSSLKETWPVAKLKANWQQMTRGARPDEIGLALQQSMVDWPDRKPDDVGWCYFSISAPESNEGIAVVVTRMPETNSNCISQLEFGRP